MALASFEDANDHLDLNKLAFANDTAAEPEAEYADAIVFSYVSDLYPANYALWTSTVPLPGGQEATPALIREIAGMLMAARLYEKRYSEEQLQPSDYAERLKRDALGLLKKLQSGEIDLWDVDYTSEGELRLSSDDFWPNDSTTVERPIPISPEFEPERFARIGDKF